MTTPILSLSVQKEQARGLLSTNQVAEALSIYTQILAEYPDDVDALLAIGDCYLAAEQIPAALKLYRRASAVKPDDPEVQRRLMLVQLESERYSQVKENGNPLEPEMISYLARALREPGEITRPGVSGAEKAEAEQNASFLKTEIPETPRVAEADIERAAKILREVLNSSTPALTVTERLAEIDTLLPALLELNVRQAREKVHPGLEKSLHAVIQRMPERGNGTSINGGPSAPSVEPLPVRVLFIHPEGVTAPTRQTLPAQALAARGCQVHVGSDFLSERLDDFDVIVAYRAHGDANLMEGLALRAAAKIPIIVDLDLDFEQMPLDHPEQNAFGLGTPAQARFYTASLLMANCISTASHELGTMLRALGHRIRVLPDGWSRQNPLWEKPGVPRHTINLGWVAPPNQVEDTAMVRRMLIRILREFPQTQLVVAGNPKVYQLFDNLPESRRLFLPPATEEDFPYLLGQMDILLAPMRQTPFNLSCSDRPLMEAGVKGIPWVASPIPAFTSWADGGLIAHSQEEWYTHLHDLISNPGLCRDLGRAGRARAAEREMGQLGKIWYQLIQEVVGPRPAAFIPAKGAKYVQV